MIIRSRVETLEKRQMNNPGVVVVFESTPGAEEDLRRFEEIGRTVLLVKFVRPKPTKLYT